MRPTDRYLILDRATHRAVATFDVPWAVALWFWGKDHARYALYDYERLVVPCCADVGHLYHQLCGRRLEEDLACR